LWCDDWNLIIYVLHCDLDVCDVCKSTIVDLYSQVKEPLGRRLIVRSLRYR
jgi:hypothetical protein